MLRPALILGFSAVFVRPVAAEPALISEDTWKFREGGAATLDGGLAVGFPTALPTGLSAGVGAGVTVTERPFNWGARAAWVTATESAMTWTVTHSDLRLRMIASLEHVAGRGTIGLRLGAGATLIHEARVRNQGERAGLTGMELRTSTWEMLPAADLEVVTALHIRGPWLMVLSAGPSVTVIEGQLRTSWIGQLGIGWQP
jgi:hypothetical protein